MSDLERAWAKSANSSLKHKQDGGYSLTNISRVGMAVKSVPLGVEDRQTTGENVNSYTGQPSAMDRRMKLYNQAADAAEKKKPIPEEWSSKFGSP